MSFHSAAGSRGYRWCGSAGRFVLSLAFQRMPGANELARGYALGRAVITGRAATTLYLPSWPRIRSIAIQARSMTRRSHLIDDVLEIKFGDAVAFEVRGQDSEIDCVKIPSLTANSMVFIVPSLIDGLGVFNDRAPSSG
jgi:hypothetical protein